MPRGPGSPASRIREISLMLHRAMRDQMTSQSRVHEIVELAIREQWSSIGVFQEDCDAIVAELVAEGQARGEFGPGDPVQACRPYALRVRAASTIRA